MDPLSSDPAFIELEDRLPNVGWTRRLTAQESLQRFRATVAGLVTSGPQPRPPSEEELHSRAVFQTYRLCRWLVQGLGWSGPADPLSFVTEVQAHRPGSPYSTKPLGMWGSPVVKQPINLASSTLPGIYDLQRELSFSGSNGLFLQPPPFDPDSDRSRRDAQAFLGSIRAGIDALGLAHPTPDQMELGLHHIDPRRFGDGSGWLTEPEEYEPYAALFPTPQEILDHEQRFLTALAEALTETTEDSLRMWLRSRWSCTEFEAFSIAQTAKGWSASLRPIDIEVERRQALRRLEGASDRARMAGDHRGEIMASSQISRILGLAQEGPADADDAAAEAALAAHEIASPDSRSELLPPEDSDHLTLEEWRAQKQRPEPRSMIE